MKYLHLTLISLFVLPLFSCTLSLPPSVAVDAGQRQLTQTVKKQSSIAFIARRHQGNKVKAGLFTVNRNGSDRFVAPQKVIAISNHLYQ